MCKDEGKTGRNAQKDTSDTEGLSKIYKGLKFYIRKQATQLKTGQDLEHVAEKIYGGK